MNEVLGVVDNSLQNPLLLPVKCMMYILVLIMLLNLTFEVYFNVLICLYKSSRQYICCMNEG